MKLLPVFIILFSLALHLGLADNSHNPQSAIAISSASLPFTILTPGYYYLSEDVNHGNVFGGPGITILSSNVTIDFNGHTLTGWGIAVGVSPGNPSANYSNVRIQNGAITFLYLPIQVFPGVDSTLIQNLTVTNTNVSQGAAIDDGGTNTTMRRCTIQFPNGTGAGAFTPSIGIVHWGPGGITIRNNTFSSSDPNAISISIGANSIPGIGGVPGIMDNISIFGNKTIAPTQ